MSQIIAIDRTPRSVASVLRGASIAIEHIYSQPIGRFQFSSGVRAIALGLRSLMCWVELEGMRINVPGQRLQKIFTIVKPLQLVRFTRLVRPCRTSRLSDRFNSNNTVLNHFYLQLKSDETFVN